MIARARMAELSVLPVVFELTGKRVVVAGRSDANFRIWRIPRFQRHYLPPTTKA